MLEKKQKGRKEEKPNPKRGFKKFSRQPFFFFSNLNQFHMLSLIWFGRQLRILPLNAYDDALRQGVDFVIFYSLLKL